MSVCRSVGPKRNVRISGKCRLLLFLLKTPSPPVTLQLDVDRPCLVSSPLFINNLLIEKWPVLCILPLSFDVCSLIVVDADLNDGQMNE